MKHFVRLYQISCYEHVNYSLAPPRPRHLPNRTPAQARFCQPLAEDTRWELRVTDVTPNRKAPNSGPAGRGGRHPSAHPVRLVQ